ncbi:hypothetical protein [Niallia sp. Krafla_26]|uniref:hypothetical protein n=1 Tax=Niallia sp. Krafla_26 TaxID=3064703 RepID=UPI003D169C0F
MDSVEISSMLPNILQLAGAILTLITAILTSLGLFQNTIQGIRAIIPGFRNEKQPKEIDNKVKIIKNTSDLRKFTRELAYAITGIILIVLGYIFAATGFDYIEKFSFYFLGPIIIPVIVILISGYNFLKPLISYKKFIKGRFLFTLIFLLFTLLSFYLMYIYEWFAIVSAFIGTTTLLIYLVIIFLENSIVNVVINRELENLYKSTIEKVEEGIGNAENNARKAVSEQGPELKKLEKLLNLDESITSSKDNQESEKK